MTVRTGVTLVCVAVCVAASVAGYKHLEKKRVLREKLSQLLADVPEFRYARR